MTLKEIVAEICNNVNCNRQCSTGNCPLYSENTFKEFLEEFPTIQEVMI